MNNFAFKKNSTPYLMLCLILLLISCTGPKIDSRTTSSYSAIFSENMPVDRFIESTTVLVFSPSTSKIGSGFFVTPKHIVTNKHVIDSMRGGIYVSAGHFQTGAKAKLLAVSGDNGDDFALLELKVIENPYVKLKISNESILFNDVIAAGYSGESVGFTQGHTSGNILNSLPNVNVTEGKVINEMRMGNEKGIIFHTAPISNGYSGGPLLDSCGNLIGINTQVQSGNSGQITIALPTSQLLKFLFENNINIKIAVENCAPSA